MLKTIGGILLVVGITIGAGMLALPLSTAPGGFIPAATMLFFFWIVLSLGALMLLEVNLWFPENSNLISMSGATLGRVAQLITWISYLLLLYAILCAYMAGSSDMVRELFEKVNITVPSKIALFSFVTFFGSFVFSGVHTIDWLNRFLMFVKLGSLFLIFFFLTPHVETSKIMEHHPAKIILASMTIVSSFSYSIIIPSIRTYFRSNVKQLRIIIIVGSFIPLICYWLWIMVVQGTIPEHGVHGLIAFAHSERSTSMLTMALSQVVSSRVISTLVHTFISVCMATSFLGVSLSLYDFLADGLKIKQNLPGRILNIACVYVLPISIVLLYPGIFIRAIDYAGACCVILAILLPSLMLWHGRYVEKRESPLFKAPGGKSTVMFVISMGSILMIVAVLEITKILPRLL